jgi:hypothetical protein
MGSFRLAAHKRRRIVRTSSSLLGMYHLMLKRLFVDNDQHGIPLALRDAPSPASVPSLAWPNINLDDNSMPAEDSGTLQSTYRDPRLDARLIIDGFPDFSLETVYSIFPYQSNYRSASDPPTDKIFCFESR